MLEEIWKTIPDFDCYEVSNLGRVRRSVGGQGTFAGRILKSSDDKEGYQQITLTKCGVYYKRKVHQLVLLAFVGACPEGHETSHQDDDPRNNALSNLAYETKAANLARRRLQTGADWARSRRRAA